MNNNNCHREGDIQIYFIETSEGVSGEMVRGSRESGQVWYTKLCNSRSEVLGYLHDVLVQDKLHISDFLK